VPSEGQGVGEVERAVTRHGGSANMQVAPLFGAGLVLNPRLLRSQARGARSLVVRQDI